jgi:plasmid stability protein
MAAKRGGNWIAQAVGKNKGAFRAKAKRAGRSTNAHARAVLKPGSRASTKTKRQAALALRLSKMRRKRTTARRRTTTARRRKR